MAVPTEETEEGDGFISAETVEAWDCVEGCPIREMNLQSGESRTTKRRVNEKDEFHGGVHEGYRRPNKSSFTHKKAGQVRQFGDGGSASRFFQQCNWSEEEIVRMRYIAKPSRWEKNVGLEGRPEEMLSSAVDRASQREGKEGTKGRGSLSKPQANIHPTCKPIALLRYLIRLVTPPGGTVLDPFVGSGTTACAVLTLNEEGHDFKCRGIEKDPEYVEIARARVAWYREHSAEWLRKVLKKK